jgi:Uma2 family endonuclease
MVSASVITGEMPIVLQFAPTIDLSDEMFFQFCQVNRELRLERSVNGDLVIMSPTGSETGGRNFDLTVQFGTWVRRDGTGQGFDSSTGFRLPNGAVRSPDVSWIRRDRWDAIPAEQRQKFAPICPDFVIELRSLGDNLETLQVKMQEYLDNGTVLGWLIDRSQRQVYIYRPEIPIKVLENPATISGDPVLPGFVLDLKDIW